MRSGSQTQSGRSSAPKDSAGWGQNNSASNPVVAQRPSLAASRTRSAPPEQRRPPRRGTPGRFRCRPAPTCPHTARPRSGRRRRTSPPWRTEATRESNRPGQPPPRTARNAASRPRSSRSGGSCRPRAQEGASSAPPTEVAPGQHLPAAHDSVGNAFLQPRCQALRRLHSREAAQRAQRGTKALTSTDRAARLTAMSCQIRATAGSEPGALTGTPVTRSIVGARDVGPASAGRASRPAEALPELVMHHDRPTQLSAAGVKARPPVA